MYTNSPQSGLASLLASRGRNGDSVLVHMAPSEVQGLQSLAMAHGGSLTINPETGLYEASFLKKILPQLAGAALTGLGMSPLKAAATVGIGYGLIEGDLKKGLQAGLGAYSGASITKGLQEAAKVGEAPTGDAGSVVETAPTTFAQQLGLKEKDLPMVTGGSYESELGLKSGALGMDEPLGPVGYVPPQKAADIVQTVTPRATPSLWQGAKNLFTTKEGPAAFMNAMGGGFQSPFMQKASQYATFAGAMMPFAEEPQQFPTGGEEGSGLFYVHGGRNPQYGSGRDQPYYLPGRWYQRTPQGVKPWRGYAGGGVINQRPTLPYSREAYPHSSERYPLAGVMQTSYSPSAPRGQEVFGGYEHRIDPFTGEEKFADGGEVGVAPPKSPFAVQQAIDPNVLATRQYIEELNARAKNPVPGPGMGGTSSGGLGSFKVPFTPYVGPGGGDAGGGGGGEDVGGGGVADLAGSIATGYLTNPSNWPGIVDTVRNLPGTVRDVSTLGTEVFSARDRAAIGDQPVEVTRVPDANLAPAASVLPAAVSPFIPDAPLRGGNMSFEELPNDPYAPESRPDYQPSTSTATSVAPAAVSAASGIASLAPAARAGQVLIEGIDTVGDIAGAATGGAGAAGAATGGAGATNTGVFGLEKGAPLTGTNAIIPGLQTALGLHQAYEGIRKGNEVQSAMGAFGAATGAASLMGYSGLAALGPIGLAAAAIAALGASMVNTKEYGDKALSNYWKAVDQGRGFGSAPPEELAQGFINFYRTNKNNFAGQERYGRTGNEDFVYDMTQVINDAVKSGKVDKGVDAATMYEKVVQPWLNSMGSGPQNADARRIQDFMMTDLIHNFMYGQPISNAQVKGDSKYKIVSERPVYAGAPPEINKYSLYNVATRAPELTYGGSRISSDVTPEDMGPGWRHRAAQLEQAAGPTMRAQPVTEQTMTDITAPPPVLPEPVSPYMPQIREEEPAPAPPPARSKMEDYYAPPPPPAEEERVYIPTPQPEEAPVYEAPVYTPPPPPVYEAPAYLPPPANPYMDYYSPYAEFGAGREFAFAGGGAIGEDYNFGFAGGGMPGEYAAGGKLLNGPGDGMSDDIPAVIRGKGVQRAALADGEFVIPADVVSHLGNGSTKAGAQKLYDMMNKVRQARTGRTKQAPAVKADRFLPR